VGKASAIDIDLVSSFFLAKPFFKREVWL
jgi:hypothetical protein